MDCNASAKTVSRVLNASNVMKVAEPIEMTKAEVAAIAVKVDVRKKDI
jgi:hypothetical protein